MHKRALDIKARCTVLKDKCVETKMLCIKSRLHGAKYNVEKWQEDMRAIYQRREILKTLQYEEVSEDNAGLT